MTGDELFFRQSGLSSLLPFSAAQNLHSGDITLRFLCSDALGFKSPCPHHDYTAVYFCRLPYFLCFPKYQKAGYAGRADVVIGPYEKNWTTPELPPRYPKNVRHPEGRETEPKDLLRFEKESRFFGTRLSSLLRMRQGLDDVIVYIILPSASLYSLNIILPSFVACSTDIYADSAQPIGLRNICDSLYLGLRNPDCFFILLFT